MRLVFITALGILVEPEVNKNLAMVSGPVACMAASTAEVTGVDKRSANEVLVCPSALPCVSTTSTSEGTAV